MYHQYTQFNSTAMCCNDFPSTNTNLIGFDRRWLLSNRRATRVKSIWRSLRDKLGVDRAVVAAFAFRFSSVKDHSGGKQGVGGPSQLLSVPDPFNPASVNETSASVKENRVVLYKAIVAAVTEVEGSGSSVVTEAVSRMLSFLGHRQAHQTVSKSLEELLKVAVAKHAPKQP